MKRTRLTRSKPLRRSGGPKGRAKGAKAVSAAARARKREKKRARSERLYGPPGFADFVRGLPCRKCGRGPSEVHHDPTAANGGTWRDTSALCSDCHTQDPRSRHEHPGGYKAFWAEIGVTREEANAETQRLWEESLDFLPSHDLP